MQEEERVMSELFGQPLQGVVNSVTEHIGAKCLTLQPD